MGKYTIISLEGCPYSMGAEELFEKSSAKFEIKRISYENKEKYKSDMNTFPQIHYERSNGDKILVGGLSDLKNLIQSTEIPPPKTIEYVLFKSIKKNFK
jgi:glutaredoxin